MAWVVAWVTFAIEKDEQATAIDWSLRSGLRQSGSICYAVFMASVRLRSGVRFGASDFGDFADEEAEGEIGGF